MHQTIAAFFQLSQKLAQHARRLRLIVVKQHDAPANLIETRQDQIEFGLRRHLFPVRRPDIRTKHRVASGVEISDQRRRIGETGETEKRRADAPGGFRRRNDSLFNIGLRLRFVHQAQRMVGMAPRMMADRMAFGGGALHQMRHRLSVMANDEKCRLGAFFSQRVEHFRGRCGRAVVKG